MEPATQSVEPSIQPNTEELQAAELSPTERLANVENKLAGYAEDMLTGTSTKEEEAEFLDGVGEYEVALRDRIGEQLGSEEGDDAVKEQLLETVFESQATIIGSAAYQHAQESLVARGREKLVRTRLGRIAGKVAIAGVIGLATYGATKGVEFGFEGHADNALVSALVAVNAPGILSGALSGGLKFLKSRGEDSIDRDEDAPIKKIEDEISAIDDPEEREEARHKLLTEARLDDFRADVLETIFHMRLDSDESTQLGVEELITTATHGLLEFYGLPAGSEGKKELGREIGGEVIDELVDIPGASDAFQALAKVS